MSAFRRQIVRGLQMASEAEEERYVREHFHQRYGVTLQKIPTSKWKRPDYELIANMACFALVEVKLFERTPRTVENGWRTDGVFLTREDNAPSRVAAAIHEKSKQLRISSLPRVLVFVNDDNLMDVGDLEEAFNGFMDYGTPETGYLRNVVSADKRAIRRIRSERAVVDLYVWIDRCDRGKRYLEFHVDGTCATMDGDDAPRFRVTSDRGYELARQFFGCPEIEKPG